MKKLVRFVTNWEQWNFFVLYLPLLPVWCWYCIKSRSLWFFTASNPTITFGGLEGEGKKEMYDQLPAGWYPKTHYIEPGIEPALVRKAISDAGFELPFVVKPDVGMRGSCFEKLRAGSSGSSITAECRLCTWYKS
jgi:hypothetical protein